jgi:hypothetical protein
VIGYGAAAALALLSHYFVLYVGLAQAVTGLAALLRNRRLFKPLALAALLAVGPVLLWMAAAGRIVGSYYGAQPGRVDLVGVLARTLARIPAGWSVDAGTATAVGLAATPLLLAGLWLARRREVTRAWVIWLAVPSVVALVVSLVRPMYQERYLAVIAPAYLLLVALVVGQAPRALRAALLVGAVAVSVVPLWNLAAGRYVRSQYGSHAAEINALGRPGEAVVLTGTSQSPLYHYYGSRNGAGLPVFGLPKEPPAREAAVGADLGEIAGRFDALWLLLYAERDYDPDALVERWLTANTYRAPPRWTINGRLLRFATERGAQLGSAGARASIAPGWRVAAALPRGPVAAGALLPIRLDFERDDTPAIASTPKLRLRLVDDAGLLWGEADEMLGSGFGLPSTSVWSERRAVPVLGGAGPGEVKVEAQLYVETAGGARPLGTLDLGKVAIAPSDRFWAGQIAAFHPLEDAVNGPWRLVGWAGAESRATGERGYLTTVWRAEGGSPPLLQLLRLVGPGGAPATREAPLGEAVPGTIRRVQATPPIGPRWAPGVYRYEVALRGPEGQARSWAGSGEWLRLGDLRVSAGAPVTAPAAPASPLHVVYGGSIRLRGYTASTAPPALTLQWEALTDQPRNLSVFVHLLDATGQIRAQSDGAPAGGRAPTDGWSTGDVVDDRRELAAAPGEYRMLVGLYDPRSGARLPAASGAGQALGDAVEIGRLRVGS